MKKVVLSAVAVLFLISLIGGAGAYDPGQAVIQAGEDGQASSTSSTRTQAKPASASASDTAAVEKRLCDRLKLFQSKLREIEKSISEAGAFHHQFKTASERVKQTSLFPIPDRKTVAKQAPQEKPALIPAEKVQGQIQVIRELKAVNQGVIKLRMHLSQQVVEMRRRWKEIEGDLSRFGRAPGGPASLNPDRQCVSTELKDVRKELSVLGSRADNLKSQIDDARSQLDQMYGHTPCRDLAADCNVSECERCCSWQNKVNEPAGTPARAVQEQELRFCLLGCEAARSRCVFENFDQKANSLFNILSTVLKNVKEMEGGIVRNIG